VPELPEAEVVARQLRAQLLGAQLNECLIGRTDIVREGLLTLSWYHGAVLEGGAIRQDRRVGAKKRE
jgi:formamidopyrimidine-DNA glycosylase